MAKVKIEGLSANCYSFIFSRTSFDQNEAKFLMKINFDISFNNTPELKMQFNSENMILK